MPPLKRTLTTEAFAALDAAIQQFYEESADGGYELALDGEDKSSAVLLRAKEHEVNARKEAEKANRELKAELAAIRDEKSRKSGDVESLDASYKEKIAAMQKEAADRIAQKDAFISKILVDGEAHRIAAEISSSPNLILPHIKARLAADLDSDTPSTKVLDATGNLSALTLEDLKKEFVANKDYSSIILASKASGSGAPQDKQSSFSGRALLNAGGGAQPLSSKSTPEEIVAHLQAKSQQ